MRTLASGTRLFVPSLVMVLAWRLFVSGGRAETAQEPVTTVGPYLVAIVILTVVTCLYTAVGGIKAVIWTDVIQACLMFGGALVAIATLLVHVGGFSAVVAGGAAAHEPRGLLPARLRGRPRRGVADRARPLRDGGLGLRQAGPRQRLHALLRGDRRHARQHGRLRHRPGHGPADADRGDAPEGAPQPDHRRLHGPADRGRVRRSSASCSSSTTSRTRRSGRGPPPTSSPPTS